MEQVQPLQTVIRTGTDPSLAIKVLRSLHANNCRGWTHYDICPKNAGLTRSDKCVFIDVDSLYRIDASKIDISVPALKEHRVPRPILEQCQQETTENTYTQKALTQKHDAGVLMLAAECCLGLFSGYDLLPEAIEDWIDAAPCDSPTKDLWRSVLTELTKGEVRSPNEVADKIEIILGAPKTHVQPLQVPQPPAPVSEHLSQPQMPVLDLISPKKWDDFVTARRTLRQDLMQADDLDTYRARMIELAPKHPKDRRWWREVLIIALSYQRDPAKAEELADLALKAFPRDAEFEQKRRMARMWPRD